MLAMRAKASCIMKLIFVMHSQTGPLYPIFPFPGSIFHCELTMTMLHEGSLPPPERHTGAPKQEKNAVFEVSPDSFPPFHFISVLRFNHTVALLQKIRVGQRQALGIRLGRGFKGGFRNWTWPLLSQTAFGNQSCRCNREREQVH